METIFLAYKTIYPSRASSVMRTLCVTAAGPIDTRYAPDRIETGWWLVLCAADAKVTHDLDASTTWRHDIRHDGTRRKGTTYNDARSNIKLFLEESWTNFS